MKKKHVQSIAIINKYPSIAYLNVRKIYERGLSAKL